MLHKCLCDYMCFGKLIGFFLLNVHVVMSKVIEKHIASYSVCSYRMQNPHVFTEKVTKCYTVHCIFTVILIITVKYCMCMGVCCVQYKGIIYIFIAGFNMTLPVLAVSCKFSHSEFLEYIPIHCHLSLAIHM